MGAHSNRADLNGSGPFYTELHVVSGNQNIVGNYTDFAWGLYIGCADNGWGTFSGSPQFWSVNIAGVGGSGTFTLDFTPAGSSGRMYQIANNPALAVGHNADGTRPGFPNYGSIDTDHSSVGDGTVVTWADAPTIPRASTSVWNVQAVKYIGTAYQLDTNRADASFTHDITYTFGSASGTIGTGVGASVMWTPPTSLLTQIPNSPTGTGTITTVTKQGGTIIGTTYSGFELTAALTVVPDFTTVTNSEATAGVAANIGGYVQGISKLNLAITGAAGVSGSTITSYKIEVAGQTLNAQSGVTPAVIANSGTVAIVGTVTDSRGRTKQKTVNITVLAYTPPAIAALQVRRSQSGGAVDENGTYLRIDLNASVASLVVATVQKNALVYRISTRLRGTSTWTLKSNTTPGGITFNSFVTVGTYNITDAYDVLVEVVDDFSTTAVQLLVGVASIYVHYKGDIGVGWGKFNERGRHDVYGEIYSQRLADYTDWRAVTNEGTAAQRDAIYGVPANDAARVALANKKLLWYNTDDGWWEQYYAVTGLSGLTALGLAAGVASGWYPIGRGPRISLVASGGQSVTGVQDIINWSAPGTGASYRRGGAAWFAYATGIISIQKYGRYRIKWHTTVQAGGGSPSHYIVSSSQGNIGLSTYTLVAGASGVSSIEVEEIALIPSETIKSINANLGPYILNEGGNGTNPIPGMFLIEYVGPSLVNA